MDVTKEIVKLLGGKLKVISFWDFLLTPAPIVSIGLVSMLVSFVIALATRLLTKKEQLQVWRKEIARLQVEISKVRRSSDKKSLEKLKRLQSQMLSIQSKASIQQMKVMPISFATYLIVWWMILVPSYAGLGRPVALLPWLWGPEPLKLGLLEWYLLCSILFGTLFNKVFGLGVGGD